MGGQAWVLAENKNGNNTFDLYYSRFSWSWRESNQLYQQIDIQCVDITCFKHVQTILIIIL